MPLPRPCRAAKGLECVFPIWFTQCGHVWFTLAMPCPCRAHTVLRPCRSESDFSRPRHSTAWARHAMCELAFTIHGWSQSSADPDNKRNRHVDHQLQSQPFIHSFHLAVCLTTGPKPLPKRALHIVRSRASSFLWEYPLLSLRSSSSFLRLLPRFPVTSIVPFILPSITCCRMQFLRKMWPIHQPYNKKIILLIPLLI